MADMTLKDWFELLKPGKTPVFRHTKNAILALERNREDVTARELAQIVLADPLATLRVIYDAYQRTGRRFNGQIATAEAAILMQGVDKFMDEASYYPILEQVEVARNEVVLRAVYRLLRLAQHSAWQARDFSVLNTDIQAEEVQVAALLYYAPEFLFWLQAPHIARNLARLRRRMHSVEAEREALGFELAPLRLKMLEEWSIAEVSRDLLDPRLAELPRQTILNAALHISHHSRFGWWDESLSADYETLAGVIHRPVDEVIAIVHANAHRAARFGYWIPAAPAAAWLPMLPGPWPPDPYDELEIAEEPAPAASKAAPPSSPARPKPAAPHAPTPARAPSRPETPATPPSSASAPMPPAGVHCTVPDAQVLKDSLKMIEGHLDGSYNLTQMSAVILKGLHQGLGLSRILFAMVTPDKKRVKSRFTLGVPSDDPLRRFEFSLDGRDLFAQLMRKPQGVWLNEGNRTKLWPMLGAEMQAIIGECDFFAMSLHANGQPATLIYADRGHGECGLDAHTYTDFKMFCLTAGRGLSRLKA